MSTNYAVPDSMCNNHEMPVTEDMLFQDFVFFYLQERANELRSIMQVRTIMASFSQHLQGQRLNQLRRLHVHNYIKKRQESGIANSSINHELTILSAAIGYVRDRWELNIPNPTQRQRLPRPDHRVRYLEKIEADRLLEAAKHQDYGKQLHAFILLGLNTGCRKNEMLHLRWEDISELRSTITLRAEMTKSQKRRVIPLNTKAKEALQAMREWQIKHNIQTEWVFAKLDGQRIKWINRVFDRAKEKAGIKDFRIHDLRHTFASWLVMHGVDLIKVRDLLGHSTVLMTERYAHLAPDRLHGAVALLDEIDFNKNTGLNYEQ